MGKNFYLALCLITPVASTAGTMGAACIEQSVTVPCVNHSKWDVAASALWLKPSSGILNANNTTSSYVTETDVSANSSASTNGNSLDYSAAFLLEAAYHFSTGNDINLNWTHLNGKDTTHTTSKSAHTDITTPSHNSSYISYFENNDTAEFDAVNLEFAQLSHWGEKTDLRIYAGGQYARMQGKVKTYETAITRDETDLTKTTYSGIGPRVGVEGHYKLSRGFSLMAQAAIGILAGDETQKMSANGKSVGSSVTYSSSSSAHHYHVIPVFDMKLAAAKSWFIREKELNVAAGWAFQQYYSAFSYATTNDQSFSLQGPYIQARYVL